MSHSSKTRLLLLGGWLAVPAKTARLIMEYDANYSLKRKDTDHHHEQIPIVQKTSIVHVNNMTDVIEELVNQFANTSADLFALDSKQIMSNSVVDAIKSTEDIGEAQYHTFLKERLYNKTIDFIDTISKNNVSLLCSDTQKKTAKQIYNLSNFNDNISLFSRMYVLKIMLGHHHQYQKVSCIKQNNLT